MGGTTAKVGIVRDGRPGLVTDFQVGGKGSFGGTRAGTGFPVKITTVDLAEVGAGGGSIAWIDADGALRVGPRSAGAVPGPACYGRGGTEPTVTDADLAARLPRSRRASPVASRSRSTRRRDALARAVADPLGIEVTDAARAVHDIVNANMAAAIRVVTVQRGIDPRGLTLVAFGGAGPMHAVRLAEMFGIGSVAVPLAAGVASAVGLVGADLHVELVQTRVVDLAGADPAELEAAFAELADQARAELADEPGTAFEVTRSADVRYRGQAYHLTLPVPDPPIERRRRRRARHQLPRPVRGVVRDRARPAHADPQPARARRARRREVRAARSRPRRTANASAARVGERDVVFPSSGTAADRHRAVRPDPARARRPLRRPRGDRRARVDHRRPAAHARRGRRATAPCC